MAVVTGIIKIKIDGVPWLTKNDGTLKPGGLVGTAIPAEDVMAGIANKFEPSMVTATLIHRNEVILTDIQAIRDAIVEVSCDNGQIYSISAASIVNAVELTNSDDGAEVAIELSGDPARLVTS